MIKTVKISLLFVLAGAGILNGQIETTKGSVTGFNIDKWYEIKLDSIVLQRLSGIIPPKDVSFQFAVPVPVNLNPGNSGSIVYKDNEMIWMIGIRSKSAKSLNLILEPFKLPDGGYVYIYDRLKRTIRGAFTNENNSPSGNLPTMPVPGEELILEYHVPVGTKWNNTLGVSQVAHDYMGVFGFEDKKDNRFGLSQSCNVDINCPIGQIFSVEKRSVCRLLIRGIELCSGFLVNNTNQQNRPLLLTAQHCITDQNDADKSLFVFGYESPWCNGPDGRVSHSISGSTLRSSNTTVDFSLVELNTFPPITYKPYLAGWDVSGTVPDYTFAIHHPLGDVKKISIDLDPPAISNFNSMPANSAWKILQWDNGTTEGGSSGSPLFDQNKRVVGILTGGEAVCGRSMNDYFVRLSVVYNYSSILWQQVKGWIDPAVTGVKQLNGRDPYSANWLTGDTLKNITSTENKSVTKYTFPGQGYSTGFNSDSLVMYAEYFNNPSPGREISEVWLNIAKATSVSTADSVRVWVLGDGAVPGIPITSKKIFISEAKDSFMLKLDFNNTVPVTGNFYIGWKIWYSTKSSSEPRQFAVYHSPDRVLPSKNTGWFNNGSVWKPFTQHPFAPMSISLDVRVITTGNSKLNYVSENTASAQKFQIFPNPASEKIFISSKIISDNVTIRFIDISGSVLQHFHYIDSFPGEVALNVAGIQSGFYLVNINSNGISETHKVLINR